MLLHEACCQGNPFTVGEHQVNDGEIQLLLAADGKGCLILQPWRLLAFN